MVSKGIDSVGDSWVLDYLCYFHMYWTRDWFDTNKACDEGFVTLTNNVECKVVGISTTKVKMFNGTVIILGNMRHVLSLEEV